jgi:hypothetical protein
VSALSSSNHGGFGFIRWIFRFVISQRGVRILCCCWYYHLFPFRRAMLAALFLFDSIASSCMFFFHSEKHEHPNPIGRLDQTALEFASDSY